MRELADLARRVADLERRMSNTMREGTVEAVDPARKRVRLRLGGSGGEPFLSPWVPYSQTAGALKIHSPPSAGQQMTLLAPAGDIRRGQAVPFTWCDAEPSPSDEGDQHVLTFGDLRIEITADGINLRLGSSEIHVRPDQILLKGSEIVTDGKTRLDRGERGVVFKGSGDSGGDINNAGSERVFV
ncbi:phage baseplate assembly protein V [Brevundimonas sp.]|uniref:phage baseplate assembly protein V n=1 Tax=Brevundimonas sp. TaxID=1871086 RepID=UPI00286B4A24|nr:phage baseplate assembly protein V [Brevundimonas sp.]